MSAEKTSASFEPIHKRKRNKNLLESPFKTLGTPLNWTSWKDDYILDSLWTCILASNLERDVSFVILRQIMENAHGQFGDRLALLNHSYLATVELNEFLAIFGFLKDDAYIMSILKPLGEIETLPDKHHWAELTCDFVEDVDWRSIAVGIANCFDHQSQAATDVRWLKICYFLIIGKIKFPSEEHVRGILEYPDYGDQRRVRPSIRAAEMIFRNEGAFGDSEDHPRFPTEKVWEEFYQKTDCFISPSEIPQANLEAVTQELQDVQEAMFAHFYETTPSTRLNPKHESVFGISFYAIRLVKELISSDALNLAVGRFVLRALVEIKITLDFLIKQKSESIWLQFIKHGTGQMGLAFSKISESASVPDFIDLSKLEDLANENGWMESEDVKIGNWVNKNLRELAQMTANKELYDKYYDLTSSFTHGRWGAIRNTTMTNCLNPMHRFHRVPFIDEKLESVISDSCSILNLLLDSLNSAYPPFKPRMRTHKKSN